MNGTSIMYATAESMCACVCVCMCACVCVCVCVCCPHLVWDCRQLAGYAFIDVASEDIASQMMKKLNGLPIPGSEPMKTFIVKRPSSRSMYVVMSLC